MKKIVFSIAKSRTKFLLLLFVVEMIVLSLISPYFFSMNNLMQVTQFGASLTLLSLGEALVMIAGRDGIDISGFSHESVRCYIRTGCYERMQHTYSNTYYAGGGRCSRMHQRTSGGGRKGSGAYRNIGNAVHIWIAGIISYRGDSD